MASTNAFPGGDDPVPLEKGGVRLELPLRHLVASRVESRQGLEFAALQSPDSFRNDLGLLERQSSKRLPPIVELHGLDQPGEKNGERQSDSHHLDDSASFRGHPEEGEMELTDHRQQDQGA
jgi:hypothetical protein